MHFQVRKLALVQLVALAGSFFFEANCQKYQSEAVNKTPLLEGSDSESQSSDGEFVVGASGDNDSHQQSAPTWYYNQPPQVASVFWSHPQTVGPQPRLLIHASNEDKSLPDKQSNSLLLNDLLSQMKIRLIDENSFDKRESIIGPTDLPVASRPRSQYNMMDSNRPHLYATGNNPSRVVRAFKPKLMSTARGFGKRAGLQSILFV